MKAHAWAAIGRLVLVSAAGFFGCSAEYGQRSTATRSEAPPERTSAAVPAPSAAPAKRAAGPGAAESAHQASTLEPSVALEPTTAPAAAAEAESTTPELYAIAREVVVRARPAHESVKIGYLRFGARVRRAFDAESHSGCSGGWYRIMPEGYVCAGNAATIDGAHPALGLVAGAPDRTTGLPYLYGRAPAPPPRYTRLPPPTVSQGALPARWADVESSPLPALLAQGGTLPKPFGFADAGDPNAKTPPNSGFALLGVFDDGGRRFGLSTDLELVPLERLERVRPSGFHGTSLLETGLPIVFVRSKSAWLYAGEPQKGLSAARQLGFREAVAISGRRVTFAGTSYLETRAGDWLKDERLVRIDALRERPSLAKGARSWVHVSILQQSLVAYEGDRPVYATLVSTGADGLGDPATTHSTVQGSFRVHTKHVTTTMQGEEEDDEFLLSDVPYVQYFREGYALHAAYWHDAFGTPRSHGCVNLSPLDARFLFHWTEPAVPQAWHAALSLHGGTLVHITP